MKTLNTPSIFTMLSPVTTQAFGQVRNHEVFVLINHGFPFHTSVTDVFKIQNYHIPSRALCAASVDWLCGQWCLKFKLFYGRDARPQVMQAERRTGRSALLGAARLFCGYRHSGVKLISQISTFPLKSKASPNMVS